MDFWDLSELRVVERPAKGSRCGPSVPTGQRPRRTARRPRARGPRGNGTRRRLVLRDRHLHPDSLVRHARLVGPWDTLSVGLGYLGA